jgi:aryl-alcohol dehydrogenase-like predicted oxidoreductase
MIDRRRFLGAAAAAGLAFAARRDAHAADVRSSVASPDSPPAPPTPDVPMTPPDAPLLVRRIPSTGEAIPALGLGTSDTFDVDPKPAVGGPVGAVYDAFVAGGGTVLDTSPMYGRAEAVLGELMRARANRQRMFVATKVWTRGRAAGEAQVAESMRRLGTTRLDLLQIHNLLDWREHVPTLRTLRQKGTVRYTGITHWTVASHAELKAVLTAEPFDFVQLNYSIATRDAERTLLPFCEERGIAVLVNRAFEDGELFRLVQGRALPPWAAEFDCASWAQFFLKFVLSHPAVTCVIPATSKPRNQFDNLRGAVGRLPDARMRERMVDWLADG